MTDPAAKTENERLIAEAKHLNGPAHLVDLASRLAEALQDAEREKQEMIEERDILLDEKVEICQSENNALARAEAAEATLREADVLLRAIARVPLCRDTYRYGPDKLDMVWMPSPNEVRLARGLTTTEPDKASGEALFTWDEENETVLCHGCGRCGPTREQITHRSDRPFAQRSEPDRDSGENVAPWSDDCPKCQSNDTTWHVKQQRVWHQCLACSHCWDRPFARQNDHFTRHVDSGLWQCDGCFAKAPSVGEIEHSEDCAFAQQGEREYRDPEQPDWAHNVNANDLRKVLSEPDRNGGEWFRLDHYQISEWDLVEIMPDGSELPRARIKLHDSGNGFAQRIATALQERDRLREAGQRLYDLTDELCAAVDAAGEDVGGHRGSLTILKELGPAVDAFGAALASKEPGDG